VAALLGVPQILTRTRLFMYVHVWLEALPPHRPVVARLSQQGTHPTFPQMKNGWLKGESFNVIKNTKSPNPTRKSFGVAAKKVSPR
jgi:hypothetical protein